MMRYLLILILFIALMPSASAAVEPACSDFLFAEDAARAGVECDLPSVTEAGIVRDHSTGRRGRVSHIVDGDTLSILGDGTSIVTLSASEE